MSSKFTFSSALLTGAKHGLEKENLRISPRGKLSLLSHFDALSVSPKDPHYSLDFAECQLEVITKPHPHLQALFKELDLRYHYVHQHIQPEFLWPYSMPPQISAEDIKIAHFGEDPESQEKARYRQGLIHRYGKMMQVISGIHYNFSLSPAFIAAYQEHYFPAFSEQEARNEIYFKMIHYFLEHYWLLLYLFGASPVLFEHSIKPSTQASNVLKEMNPGIYAGAYATSLRQSDLGYHNPKNCELMVCFESLETYITTLKKATETPYPPYEGFPADQQLNTHYLQNENEFYAPIRPKQQLKKNERPLDALASRGVAYLEVRILDLNPFSPYGVSLEQLAFVELMLLTGLFVASEDFTCDSMRFTHNALLTSLQGRDPSLRLDLKTESLLLTEWAARTLKDMEVTAQHLSEPLYKDAIAQAQFQLQHPHLLPSSKILAQVKDFSAFMLQLAHQHQDFFLSLVV